MNVFQKSGLGAIAGMALVAAAAPAAAAVTVGNPATFAGNVDGCTACTFVVNQAFGVAGKTVSTYSFYAGSSSSITPLLLTRTDNGTTATFTIVGVGLLRNAVAGGVNTFDFNVVSGTNITTANTYFGFSYDNGGVVTFDYYTPPAGSGTFVGSQGVSGVFGGTFNADFSSQPDNAYNALDARTYSINATAVPEPATWALMILGFGMVGFGLRRVRKQSVRVTFA